MAASTIHPAGRCHWMWEWRRSTAPGNVDRPKNRRPGLSMSMRQAPAMPAATAGRAVAGEAASRAAHTPRPTVPSTLATSTKPSQSSRSSPQCSTMSMATCDATPAAKATTGRRVSNPRAAPASAWLVMNTLSDGRRVARYCSRARLGATRGGSFGCLG